MVLIWQFFCQPTVWSIKFEISTSVQFIKTFLRSKFNVINHYCSMTPHKTTWFFSNFPHISTGSSERRKPEINLAFYFGNIKLLLQVRTSKRLYVSELLGIWESRPSERQDFIFFQVLYYTFFETGISKKKNRVSGPPDRFCVSTVPCN